MAFPTKVDVCNMALALCGVKVGYIDNFTTDETAEAELCRALFESAKKEALIEHPWPWALGMLTFDSANRNTSSAESPWTYVYDAASQATLQSLTMLDFCEFVDSTTVRHTYRKIDYMKRRNSAIHTDYGPTTLGTGQNAVSAIVITDFTPTTEPEWDDHFCWALAWLLASKLCSPLGAPQLRPLLLEGYRRFLGEAMRHAGNNQENVLPPPDSEPVTERLG